MFLSIDPANGLAIYDQIVRQVKFAIAGGALRSGEMVPSVRELARELTVNPNTVARAYRQLQADDVLAVVRGTGLEVSAAAPKHCRKARLDLLRARLRDVVAEARQSQLDEQELRRLFEAELSAPARKAK